MFQRIFIANLLGKTGRHVEGYRIELSPSQVTPKKGLNLAKKKHSQNYKEGGEGSRPRCQAVIQHFFLKTALFRGGQLRAYGTTIKSTYVTQ